MDHTTLLFYDDGTFARFTHLIQVGDPRHRSFVMLVDVADSMTVGLSIEADSVDQVILRHWLKIAYGTVLSTWRLTWLSIRDVAGAASLRARNGTKVFSDPNILDGCRRAAPAELASVRRTRSPHHPFSWGLPGPSAGSAAAPRQRLTPSVLSSPAVRSRQTARIFKLAKAWGYEGQSLDQDAVERQLAKKDLNGRAARITSHFCSVMTPPLQRPAFKRLPCQRAHSTGR